MTTKKMTDLSHIDTLEDLHAEQRMLKLRIGAMQNRLRDSVQQIPGELVYTGINAVVPAFLSGKLVTNGLGLVRDLINKFFGKEDAENTPASKNQRIFKTAKSLGLFSVLRIAYKLFMKRKR